MISFRILAGDYIRNNCSLTRFFSFAGYPRENMPDGLPFRLSDYLELVDWSGRIIREDKSGYIPDNVPTILQRLDMDARHWVYLSR